MLHSSLMTLCSSTLRLLMPPAICSMSTPFLTCSRKCLTCARQKLSRLPLRSWALRPARTCAMLTSACSSALQISVNISFMTVWSMTVVCVILRMATAIFEPRSASTMAPAGCWRVGRPAPARAGWGRLEQPRAQTRFSQSGRGLVYGFWFINRYTTARGTQHTPHLEEYVLQKYAHRRQSARSCLSPNTSALDGHSLPAPQTSCSCFTIP